MPKLSVVNGRGLAANKPAEATEGYQYYETDTLLLKRYSGSAWELLTSVITPTGAPELPWWTRRNEVFRIMDSTLNGTSIVAVGSAIVNMGLMGITDAPLDSVNSILLCGGQTYKTTPVLNTFYGYDAVINTASPFQTCAMSRRGDWYMRFDMATAGDIASVAAFYGISGASVDINEPWQRLGHLHTATYDAQTYIHYLGFKCKVGTDTNWMVAGAYNGAPLGSNFQYQEQDTGIAFTADTPYILEMVRSVADAACYFYINGSLVATVADTLASTMHALNVDAAGPKPYVAHALHTAGPTEIRWEQSRWMIYTRQPGMSGFAGSW